MRLGPERLLLAVEILLLLLVGVACAAYSGQVAASKGHDAGPWALGGLLLGPLALLASLGLPDLKLRRYLRLLAEHQGALGAEPQPTEKAWRSVAQACSESSSSEEDVDAQRRRILGQK